MVIKSFPISLCNYSIFCNVKIGDSCIGYSHTQKKSNNHFRNKNTFLALWNHHRFKNNKIPSESVLEFECTIHREQLRVFLYETIAKALCNPW